MAPAVDQSWPPKRLRARGRDIAELFGYAPDDTSDGAVSAFESGTCPFSGRRCSKIDHSTGTVYGVCSVTRGSKAGPQDDVVVCPQRLYAGDFSVLEMVVRDVWGQNGPEELIIGGTAADLRRRALAETAPVVAFGQHSAREVSTGSMSMDWVLQSYGVKNGRLIPASVVGVEVQSIDITGNYRDPWSAYRSMKAGQKPSAVPDSGHGLNWANVHKRLVPQLIRKGNIYRRLPNSQGFFFLTPEAVFQRFESILGPVECTDGPATDVLSVRTFALGDEMGNGKHRALLPVRSLNLRLDDVAAAFVSHVDESAVDEFAIRLAAMLD